MQPIIKAHKLLITGRCSVEFLEHSACRTAVEALVGSLDEKAFKDLTDAVFKLQVCVMLRQALLCQQLLLCAAHQSGQSILHASIADPVQLGGS